MTLHVNENLQTVCATCAALKSYWQSHLYCVGVAGGWATMGD